ncbi:hypothetical protein BDV95DRAFT_630503 [Massariosphaeria phaeospora]|uniref:CCHC-type domain-containing protein n=1 Tax=Massariosphaeria phaeospora TaxID=100035 RepID=A0A7C8I230_9PLEO|nr:hypothetical protein BDV95DRAFT_630503 [Massariosphaeria phaeospora]
MARGHGALTASAMVSNPYPRPRETQPINTICEVCTRTIMTKNWQAHKNSKRHRDLEQLERTKESGIDSAAGSSFGGDTAFGAPDSTTGNGWGGDGGAATDGWGAVDSSNGFGGTGGSGTLRGGGGGGGGGRECFGCGEVGHNKRDCPKSSGGRACFNCGQTGHNKADCQNDRVPGAGGGGDRACFGCGKPGHNKADCPDRQAGGGGGGGGGVCHNCYEPGHRKSECPNERVMKCNNCDVIGHMGRDCPEPKDWSRVKCNNCQQSTSIYLRLPTPSIMKLTYPVVGHTFKRCKEPIAENEGGGSWDNAGAGAAIGSWDNPAGAATDGGAAAGDWANAETTDDQWGGAQPAVGW